MEKYINIDAIPKMAGFGANKDKQLINWDKSPGCVLDFIFGDIKGEIKILEYIKTNGYVIVEYNGETFPTPSQSLKNCKISKLLKKYTGDYKLAINETVCNNGRNMIITAQRIYVDELKINRKQYMYKCLNCSFDGGGHYRLGEFVRELWASEDNLLHKKGCPCCNNKIVVCGINDIPTTNSEMVKFFQGGYDEAKRYTEHSKQEVLPICPDCNLIRNKKMKISTIGSMMSIGCRCGDGFSFGHKYVFNMLQQLGIKFEDNKKVEWCKFIDFNDISKVKFGEYDFIIENGKLIIEVDGGFHKKDNKMSGQTKEHSEYLDYMKDLKAKENGYKVVRIDSTEDIKIAILNSELNVIYDISKVIWDDCREFALSNRIKEACSLWMNGVRSTLEISSQMSNARGTIIGYLKKGAEFGWCDYDSKEIMGDFYNSKHSWNYKPIEVFDSNKKSIGIYDSKNDLCRNSLNDLGVRLHVSILSKKMKIKGADYKGFTFK